MQYNVILYSTLLIPGRFTPGRDRVQAPETYDAFADVTLDILCDGTFDEGVTDFIRTTVRNLQQFCREDGEDHTRPAESDIDRLQDFALEWCKHHQGPIL